MTCELNCLTGSLCLQLRKHGSSLSSHPKKVETAETGICMELYCGTVVAYTGKALRAKVRKRLSFHCEPFCMV